MPKVLALGLDPAFVKLPGNPQLDRIRALDYEAQTCLVDLGETAESVTSGHLRAQSFDCVLMGAGLRDPDRLLLFEKLINVVHALAPDARICFNTTPADSAEAVRRWA